MNNGPSHLSARKIVILAPNRSSAGCYAPTRGKQSATNHLEQNWKSLKNNPLVTTHYNHVYPLRALPLHQRHARPTVHRRRALNGRHSARHRLRLRRPARTHVTLHRSIRRIHRQRTQTSPRGAKQVPHKRRRATRQTLPPLTHFVYIRNEELTMDTYRGPTHEAERH